MSARTEHRLEKWGLPLLSARTRYERVCSYHASSNALETLVWPLFFSTTAGTSVVACTMRCLLPWELKFANFFGYFLFGPERLVPPHPKDKISRVLNRDIAHSNSNIYGVGNDHFIFLLFDDSFDNSLLKRTKQKQLTFFYLICMG